MFTNKKIGIIGTGNMGEILIRGLMEGNVVDRGNVLAAEINPERKEFIQETYGINVESNACAVAEKSDILILAVKPQNLSQVLTLISDSVNEEQLLISIVAGANTGTIAEHFPEKEMRVVRVMPNAPALVLTGASGMVAGRYATEEDIHVARGIFNQVGITVVVEKEEFIDIVTGLSGSGPAFIFMIIEALSDAGVQQGLSRKIANRLAAQTVYGAGKMFLETGLHAGALKDLVATPGGTTFAGLRALENGNFRAVIMDAVEAATQKSRDLGKKKG